MDKMMQYRMTKVLTAFMILWFNLVINEFSSTDIRTRA
jgi:hypothetical protein